MRFSNDCHCTVEGTAEFVKNATNIFLMAAKLIPSDGIPEAKSEQENAAWELAANTAANAALAAWKAGNTVACPCGETTETALWGQFLRLYTGRSDGKQEDRKCDSAELKL
jgi:hypothetical protein